MELDGEPVALDQLAALAFVPYGHFTSIRVDAGTTRGLGLHLDRLAHDCQLMFNTVLDLEKVRACLRRIVAGVQGSLVVRITVFDPTLQLAHPGAHTTPRLLLSTRPAPPLGSPPFDVQARPYTRERPLIKHVGLYSAIHEKRLAQRNGFDDALFFGHDGLILEGPTWNVGFYDGHKVIWPLGDMLDGVTLRLLRRAHSDTITRPIYLRELPEMRAAFATNAAIGVKPISGVNGFSFSVDHWIIRALQDAYSKVEAEIV